MARTDLRARITAAIHAIESGECADYTEAALKYGVDRTTIPALSSAMAELKHTSPKSPELSIRSVSGKGTEPLLFPKVYAPMPLPFLRLSGGFTFGHN
jgi:hypothetical protein